MSNSTSWAKLKDVCQTTSGGTPSRDRVDFYGGDIPWVKSGELKDGWIEDTEEKITQAGFANSSAKKFPVGTILIALYGATVGKLGILRIEATTNQAVCGISPNKQLDRDFLFYFLLKQREKLIESRTGGAQPNISQEIIRELQVPIPPLTEQRRITNLLARADRLRRLRRYARQLSDTYLQSVFVEMFGYPVRNERGWEIVTLKELVRQKDTINYGVVQPGDDYPGGVPIVRVGDFDDIPENTDNLKRIDPAIEADYKRSRLKGDEILIACVGSIGKIAVIDNRLKGFNIVRATARVPVGNSINRLFLASYLKTQFVQDYFIKETRTVSQPTLNIEHIEATPVPLPPLGKQERFADIVQRYERLRAQQAEAERQAEMLFQSLLAEAFS